MRTPLHALSLAAAAALLASCGEPPPVAEAPVKAPEAAAAPAPGPAPAAPAGELKAGVGYNPKFDPLVNTKTLVQPHDPSTATEGDWLFCTLDGNPRSTNPLMASSTYEFMLDAFLYDGPFTFDAKLNWKLNDAMAESVTESPDHKVWTLKLKKGLQWQDGTPFTARDIQFSYEMIMNPAVVTAQRSGTDELESVKALDDLTVEYVHKVPLPTSKWNVNFSLLPKHIYEKDQKANPDLKSGEYYSKVNREGIGNGPYRLLEWKENDKLVLERWEDYPGPKPHFQRIVCRIIPDQNIQLLSLEKGDTDETRLSTKQFADETVRSEAFRKIGQKARGTQWDYAYISWNARGNPFFGDANVRRAMTMACNIPLMIDKLNYNLVTPCYGIFHPDSWQFNPEVKLLPFDLVAAGKLLDEAGWKTSEEDGWRHKGDQKFSFTLMIPQGASISVELAAVFQQDLKSIGVEMKTQIIEWAVFQEKTRKHEVQASIAAWGTGVDPDLSWNVWHSEMIDQEGGRNYSCFSNKRVDELFRLGRAEFDPTKRRDFYREIQKIIYDEQPYTFLWNRPTLWAFNRRIRGVTFSPRGVWNFDPSFLAWWVAKSEQAHGSK